MRKERLSETEHLKTKADIENIKEKISLLRTEKNKLINQVRWYEYSKQHKRTGYIKSLAFQMFGKRYKDLNKIEKREYNRERTRASRKMKLSLKEA